MNDVFAYSNTTVCLYNRILGNVCECVCVCMCVDLYASVWGFF